MRPATKDSLRWIVFRAQRWRRITRPGAKIQARAGHVVLRAPAAKETRHQQVVLSLRMQNFHLDRHNLFAVLHFNALRVFDGGCNRQ